MTPDAFRARRDALDAELATIPAASAVPTTAERLVDAGTLEQEWPHLDDDTRRAALRLFSTELRVRRGTRRAWSERTARERLFDGMVWST